VRERNQIILHRYSKILLSDLTNYKKKAQTVMVNNSTNINKTNNHLSPLTHWAQKMRESKLLFRLSYYEVILIGQGKLLARW